MAMSVDQTGDWDDDNDVTPQEWANIVHLSRGILNAAVYFSALLIFDIPLARAIIISILAAFLHFAHYGTRWVERLGFVMIVTASAVWIGALPAPRDWPTLGLKAIHEVMVASANC